MPPTRRAHSRMPDHSATACHRDRTVGWSPWPNTSACEGVRRAFRPRSGGYRSSPRLHVDLGPVGKARESVRDERVGGGDSFSGLRTQKRVFLVVLEHLAQFVCAREELVVGIGGRGCPPLGIAPATQRWR